MVPRPLQIRDYESEIYSLRERVDQLVYTLNNPRDEEETLGKTTVSQTELDQLLDSGCITYPQIHARMPPACMHTAVHA